MEDKRPLHLAVGLDKIINQAPKVSIHPHMENRQTTVKAVEMEIMALSVAQCTKEI